MPLGTSENGIDPVGDIFTFTVPGGVVRIERGTAMVSYGPEITLQPGEGFPQLGIFEITAGEMTADNAVFIRTVTITPVT